MAVLKYFWLVFHLVMALQLKQDVNGICCSPKWQLQLTPIFIPTFVSKNMQIETTVLLVDLILVLSLLLLPLWKYYINLIYQKSLLLLISLQSLPLLKLLFLQVFPKFLEVLAVPAVVAVLAQSPIQYDLHGIFQHQIANWNS